jgi:hypothetical protein
MNVWASQYTVDEWDPESPNISMVGVWRRGGVGAALTSGLWLGEKEEEFHIAQRDEIHRSVCLLTVPFIIYTY